MNSEYLNKFKSLFYNIDKDVEVKEILEQASDIYSRLICKFGEIVNELSAGTTRKNEKVDRVITLFSRKIMEELDAINVLFSIGAFEQVKILLRVFIENIVSLHFILNDETEMEKRAWCYYLYDQYYSEIELYELYKDKGIYEDNEELEKLLDKKMSDFEESKQKDSLVKQIDDDRLRKKGNSKRIEWYKVCSDNAGNREQLIKVMADELDEGGKAKEILYFIYRDLSKEIHSGSSTQGFVVENNKVYLENIRKPINGNSIFSIVCTCSSMALRKIYDYVEVGEEQLFETTEFYIKFTKDRDIVESNLSKII